MDPIDASFAPEPPDHDLALAHNELLIRYLAGDVSPTERTLAEQLLATSSEVATFVTMLRERQRAEKRDATSDLARGRMLIAERVGFAPSHLSLSDERTIGQAILPAASATSSQATSSSASFAAAHIAARTSPRRVDVPTGVGAAWRRGRWALVGAMAAALVVAVWGGRSVMMHAHATPSLTYTSYATGNGQVAHLTLDDGSRVTLAPNTTFGVSRDFTKRRDVVLTGEAYFDVAAAHHTPFLVHTGRVVTRVLGTSFDVRRYAGDPSTRVIVTTGRVAVAGRQGVTLAAGGMGYVTDSTALATTVTSAPSYTAWTDGVLTFRDVPASELLDAVGHWYGLEFRLADSTIARRPVVAVITSGESRADALDMIGKLLNASLSFTDTEHGTTIVTVHPKRAGRDHAPIIRSRDGVFPNIQEVGR